MRRRVLLAVPVLLAARPSLAQAPALPVVASFSILADLARQVGGERAAVRGIVGPETDAHGFQPRPADAEAVRGAAVLVRNGLGFDPWIDRLARAANFRGRLVTASEGVQPRTMEADAHGHSHGPRQGAGGSRPADPHAWQDPRNARLYVRNIAAGLAAVDPAGQAAYAAAAAALDSRLAALHEWAAAQFAAIPADRRKILTSHDAFGYLGAAYGLTLLSPQGISTESEPSAAAVARLIRQVKAERITAVFVENMTNPATLDLLAREAGVRVRGRLFSDALSNPDGPASTYEAMFRHNVTLMAGAMRGDS